MLVVAVSTALAQSSAASSKRGLAAHSPRGPGVGAARKSSGPGPLRGKKLVRTSHRLASVSGRQRSRPWHGFDSLRLSGGQGQPQARELTVYLPKGYGDDPNRTYPVLYMQDGQNVFEYGPAGFGNGWDIATSMEKEVAEGRAEPAIIVAIFNDAVDRIGEYATISRDVEMGGSSIHVKGRADRYVDYVADVVRPHIEARYLTRAGRGSTALGGSSMGGLVSIHGALRRPDVFGKVLASSPSLWFDKGIIDRAAASDAPLDLYLDNGGVGAEGDNAPHVDRLRDAMQKRRAATGKGNVWHSFDANAGHTEAAWRERFPGAFSALFAR